MSQEPELPRVPLAEEHLQVEKSAVVTGKVTVRTVTEVSEQLVKERLAQEAVEVVRVSIEKEVATPPNIRTEDGVLIVPVLEERLVVEKRLFLVEELHLRTRVTHDTVEVPVSIRKQKAVVNRTSDRPADE